LYGLVIILLGYFIGGNVRFIYFFEVFILICRCIISICSDLINIMIYRYFFIFLEIRFRVRICFLIDYIIFVNFTAVFKIISFEFLTFHITYGWNLNLLNTRLFTIVFSILSANISSIFTTTILSHLLIHRIISSVFYPNPPILSPYEPIIHIIISIKYFIFIPIVLYHLVLLLYAYIKYFIFIIIYYIIGRALFVISNVKIKDEGYF